MITPRRCLVIALSALALTAPLFTASGCKPKSTPTPFTATLTELEGVQAVYTLRHPKLILTDLDKLMSEVPETAMLRMFLGQFSAYGYPEFSELAAGSNIGVALLEAPIKDWEAGKFTVIGFAQLKQGGKIWTALTQKGLVLEQRGAWTWIAKDQASFAQLKSADALTQFIARPQTEELRAWGRTSPALLASLHDTLLDLLKTKLTDRPAPEQKALLAYSEVAWSYLAQLHSGGATLDFNDHGITLTSSAQFIPDSPIGTLLRYPATPAPKIAQSLPADGLIHAVIRGNPTGQSQFMTGLFDALIAVDYPDFAEPLKQAKANCLATLEHSDAGAVLSMDMTLPLNNEQPKIKMIGLTTGDFTEKQLVTNYRSSVAGAEKLTNTLFTIITALSPRTPMPENHQQFNENVLTIDGIPFSSVVTTTKTSVAGAEKTTTNTVLYGVVNGNIVYAIDEASLRAKLPALIAAKPLPNAIQLAPKNDELALMAVQGEKIVQMVAESVHVDLNDADILAQIKTLKDGYTTAGPVMMSMTASQAQGTVTLTIPYKFIEQSVKLGFFAKANQTQLARH